VQWSSKQYTQHSCLQLGILAACAWNTVTAVLHASKAGRKAVTTLRPAPSTRDRLHLEASNQIVVHSSLLLADGSSYSLQQRAWQPSKLWTLALHLNSMYVYNKPLILLPTNLARARLPRSSCHTYGTIYSMPTGFGSSHGRDSGRSGLPDRRWSVTSSSHLDPANLLDDPWRSDIPHIDIAITSAGPFART
jgi:hypothetical protein